jgi:hypothetical protein
MVRGGSPYSPGYGNYSIVAHTDASWEPLTLGTAHDDGLVHGTDTDWYRVEVSSGEHLAVLVTKATNWCGSLYIRRTRLPDPADGATPGWDARSYQVWGAQFVEIPATVAGSYYVLLRGGSPYSPGYGNYTITARTGTTPLPRLVIGEPQRIIVTSGMPASYELEVPAGEANLFITLQKDANWNGTLTLYYGSEVVAAASGTTDLILQVPTPEAGTYIVAVSGYGSGVLGAWTSLPELSLGVGDWQVGTILRQWGSAWYQINVPPGQSLLSVAVETIGIWSKLQVFYGVLDGSPEWSATGDRMNLQITSPPAGMYYVHLTDSAWIQGDSQARDHMIKADVVPIPPPPAPGPLITSITPTTGGTAGPVTVTINGQGLDATATVCLRRAGYADIFATSVTGTDDGRTLAATFDLSAAEPGEWTLVVTNLDLQEATAPTLFTVESGGEARIWYEIVGRGQIRLAREQTYVLRCGNSGTVDAHEVLLILQIPKGVSYRLDLVRLDFGPGLNVPLGVETEDAVYIPLFLGRIRAGCTRELDLHLQVPAGTASVRAIRAFLVPTSPLTIYLRHRNNDLQARIDAYRELFREMMSKAKDKYYGDISQADFQAWFDREWSRTHSEMRAKYDSDDCFQSWWDLVMDWAGMFDGPIVEGVTFIVGVSDLWDLFRDGDELKKELAEWEKCYIGWGLEIPIVLSISPEDKYGPSGYDAPGTPPGGLQRWIPAERPIDYRIDFWNEEDAPAATCDVIVTDQLDPNLDRATFKFTEFGFLDWRVQLEPCQYFNVDVENVQIDLSRYYPGAGVINLVVNVEGTFDPATGQIEWQFHALDPITRQPPEDPLAGFLPPITDSGWEIGWVAFDVSPLSGVPTGTVVENQSYVKFDVDVFKAAPPGGPFTNTVDSVAPTSGVLALPTESPYGFHVCWSGTDDAGGSGVHDYSIYVSDNGGPYTAWLTNTTETCAMFEGVGGHAYSFYSVARDNVGNVEGPHALPDATTTVASFADVPPDHWARPFIDAISREGITGGCDVDPLRYCPDSPVTRGQMAVFVCRAAGLAWLDPGAATFVDVPRGADGTYTPPGSPNDADGTHMFYGWIERLADPASWPNNTPPTAGCGGGYYCVDQATTRAQMATFLCRATGKTWLDPGAATFPDVPRGDDGIFTPPIVANGCDADGTHQFYGWIERLADIASWGAYGAPTRGFDDGTFRPNNNCTRAEMAVFLCRAFGIPY